MPDHTHTRNAPPTNGGKGHLPEQRPPHDASAPLGKSALQRLADASGETRRLRQLQLQADHVTPGPLRQLKDAADPVIQRVPKVGFEMEDAHWRSWVEIPKSNILRGRRYVDAANANGIRPAKRKEVLDKGAGFALEADGFTEDGQKLADIEFVTEPFPLDVGGYRGLEAALKSISSIYRQIGGMAGRDHTRGEFVTPSEAGFSNASAALSKGEKDAKLNLQATSGLGLEDIAPVFSAMTTDPERIVTHNPEAYLAIQFGNTRDQKAEEFAPLKPISEGPVRAFAGTFTYLEENLPPDTLPVLRGSRMALIGFVSALIAFLSTMKNVSIQGGLKTYLGMMHRNDFATLFGLLPEPVKAVLRANHQIFIDAVLFGVLSDIDLTYEANKQAVNPATHRTMQVADRFFLENKFKSAFFTDAVLPNTEFTSEGFIGISYGVIPSLTVQQWIVAWMRGGSPADLLTEANFSFAANRNVDENAKLSPKLDALKKKVDPKIAGIIDWESSSIEGESMARLKFNYGKLTPDQRKILDYHFRGVGSEGSKIDTDDNEKLALFENRAMSPVDRKRKTLPTEVPMDIATESILEYFYGMALLLMPQKP